jgi:Phage portal protein, SPP1 Gp6-like.
MSFLGKIIDFFKGVWGKLFGVNDVSKAAQAQPAVSDKMVKAITTWDKYYRGDFYPSRPSLRMAATIAGEAARLATIELGVPVSGSPRADWLNERMEVLLGKLRRYLELGCALGGMLLVPTSTGGVSMVKASDFVPTDYDGDGNVTGAILPFRIRRGDVFYTRLEWHRFEGEVYIITNKAFKSSMEQDLGQPIPLTAVQEWASIQPEITIHNLEHPLWGYYRNPMANDVDTDSPLGVSIYSRAIDSLDDLDAVYALFRHEIKNSKKKVFVSSQILPRGVVTDDDGNQVVIQTNPIPDLIQGLELGVNADDTYHEFNPEIRIDEIRKSMQTALDLVANQCGFSNGYFSFDEKTGTIVTATEIEADQQRTVSTCTDIQKALQTVLDGLLYALNAVADLYDLAPAGEYEAAYAFKDLSVNVTEDRARAWQMVLGHVIPKWKYLVDYEGYSEEDARKTVAEAESSGEQLFDGGGTE